MTDVCLSVAYIGPEPRTEKPKKTNISTEVADVTCDSDATFKVKRSKVNFQGAWHIVTALCTVCRFSLASCLVVAVCKKTHRTFFYLHDMITRIAWMRRRDGKNLRIWNGNDIISRDGVGENTRGWGGAGKKIIVMG